MKILNWSRECEFLYSFLISFESDAEEIFNNNRVLQTDGERKQITSSYLLLDH